MANQTSDNNKRIAKNTMLLYVRMFVLMAVNLFTSRVVLQCLGVEDFGIYGIVGSVVSQTSRLGDAQSERLLITSKVITYQRAFPLSQKGAGMFTRAAFAEVVDHRLQIFKGPRCIGPQVSSVRFLIARLEHRHRRLVGMKHRVAENLVLQGIDQRLQLNPAHAHPLRQR